MSTIRKALLGDAPALTRLLRGLRWFKRMASEPPETTAANVARHLEQSLEDDSHSIYVAEESGGGMVGYVAIHWLPYLFMPGPEGYISELFIQEDARGAGLGGQLLQYVMQEARQRGCYRLSLLNSKDRESYERKFYEKHGWEARPDMVNFVYFIPETEEKT